MTKALVLLTTLWMTAPSAFAEWSWPSGSDLASARAKCDCPDKNGKCDFANSQKMIRKKLDGLYKPEVGYSGTVKYCGESHDITFYFEPGPMNTLQASYKVGPFGKSFPACVAPDPENDKDIRMFLLSAMPPCENAANAPEENFVTLKKSELPGTITMIGSKGEVSDFKRPLVQVDSQRNFQSYESYQSYENRQSVTW